MFSLASRVGEGSAGWRRALTAWLAFTLTLTLTGEAVGAEAEGYVVAPFENASGVKALDWMASALAVVAAEKLESVSGLRPAYDAGVIDGWPAAFDAARAAQRARVLGAAYVLRGSFSRPGWKAGVTLQLLVRSGDGLAEVARAEVVGEREQVVAVLDRALDEILARRGLSPEGEALAALHRAPTRDVYALTLFGRGLNALYGLGVQESVEQAGKTLERTVHIDPKFAEAHRLLGRVYLAAGDEARAATQYGWALDLRPGYYAALSGLCRLHFAAGKRAPARELAERALSLRPWDAEVRQIQAAIELETGELDAAVADAQKVVEARPRSVPARRLLSQVHAGRGEVAELAADLLAMAELLPDDIEVRLDLGAALMRLGRNDRAVAVYEEIARRQPRHLQAHKFLGDLYRRLGDPARAATAYERVKHLAPDDPRPYFLLGAAYADAGRDDKAVAILEEAQQFKAYLGEAWTDLGALALRRGDVKRAETLLSRAVARSPMRPRTRFNYALLLDATQKRERALEEVRVAGELDPEEADYPYLAGVILLRLGRLDEAKAAFAGALKLRPDHADARHNLALLDSLDKRYGGERAGSVAQ